MSSTERRLQQPLIAFQTPEPSPLQSLDVLVFDLSNLAYISAAGQQSRILSEQNSKTLAVEACLAMMRQIYRMFRPKTVWFACDSPPYWRSALYPAYKANRQDHPLRQCVRTAIAALQEEHAELCLHLPNCEADDLIFGVTQYVKGEKIIVSSDRDFLQLLGPSVRLFNPMDMRFRPPSRRPAFDIFEKCIRGDRADNIASAHPRVTLKLLRNAFQSAKGLEHLMQTQRADGSLVKGHYELNKTLIDLRCLPPEITAQLETLLANKTSPTEGSGS